MREFEVESVTQFLDFASQALWLPRRDLWFRGVASPDYTLTPSLVRMGEVKWERNYVHGFLVGFRAYMDDAPLNPWELYGLMQHNGLPTRLLDWTRSPLYALYFALTQEPHLEGDRVVWMLAPHALNQRSIGMGSVCCPATLLSRDISDESSIVKNIDAYLPEALDSLDHRDLPAKPIAIEAPLSYRRIRSQMGCFTIHGKSDAPIESYFPEPDTSIMDNVTKVLIKCAGKREQFLHVLHTFGVNEETIYQDLPSLAARIVREEMAARALMPDASTLETPSGAADVPQQVVGQTPSA